MILMTCVIKNDDKFYLRLFLEDHWFLSRIVVTQDEKILLQKILVSEKELIDINFENIKKCIGGHNEIAYLILVITCVLLLINW